MKKISPFKGKHHTEEVKKKLSESRKGKRNSPRTEFKKGKSWSSKMRKIIISARIKNKNWGKWNIGKKHTQKWKQKMSKSHKGQKNGNWKGGISIKNRREWILLKANQRRARKLGAEGSHTIEEWRNLKKKYDYKCLCCSQKEPNIKLTKDHIIPLKLGGTEYINNIQPLCLSCNCRKFLKIINYATG